MNIKVKKSRVRLSSIYNGNKRFTRSYYTANMYEGNKLVAFSLMSERKGR